MGQKVHRGQDGRRWYLCPGCESIHELTTWQWNGSVTAPTLRPSVLVRFLDGHDVVEVCHSYVTDGKAQFLSDSTHRHAGATVELLDWPFNLTI